MDTLMRRQGWGIGRDRTERLMRLAGVRGVRTSKTVFTTRSEKTVILPGDLVNRRFTAGGDLDGSNCMAMVYMDRIAELGAVPSTGTVGDSFDDATVEAGNNLHKTELVRQRGP